MSDSRAVIEWPNGQMAALTLAGWRVDPYDEILVRLLNERYSLVAVQARRAMFIPDLLATASKAVALACCRLTED